MVTNTQLQWIIDSYRTFLLANPVFVSPPEQTLLCPGVVCAVQGAVGVAQSSSAGGCGCPSVCPSLILFALSLFHLP